MCVENEICILYHNNHRSTFSPIFCFGFLRFSTYPLSPFFYTKCAMCNVIQQMHNFGAAIKRFCKQAPAALLLIPNSDDDDRILWACLCSSSQP